MPVDLKDSSAPLAEISQGPNAFEQFLDRNQKGLIVFAVLLALGAIAAVIHRGIEQSREETAGAALNKAEDVAAYQAVVDDNGGTHAAGSAMILLANAQWTANKRDEAIATLQKLVASTPEHPAIPSAKANLASKLMAQGKTGDATKLFEELAADPSARFIAPFALISLGDMAKAAGDLEKAEASFAKVKNDFPDSPFGEPAARRIATLKAKPPVEIEPPPAPVTPPPANPGTTSAPVPPSLAPLAETVVPTLETTTPETPAENPPPVPAKP